MTITVYSRPDCHRCRAVKAWLTAREITFTARDVEADAAALAEAEATGLRELPIVIADGLPPWSGLRPDLLHMAAAIGEAS